MWRRLDSAQAHGHGLRSWRELRFRLGLAVGRIGCDVRALISVAAPRSGLQGCCLKRAAWKRLPEVFVAAVSAPTRGSSELSGNSTEFGLGAEAPRAMAARMQANSPESALVSPAKPRPAGVFRFPRQPSPGHKRKRPRRGGAVCRSGSSARGRAAGCRLDQSSPLDRSSSATTSAAAHSRASRSLRSRSAFSTASMYSGLT